MYWSFTCLLKPSFPHLFLIYTFINFVLFCMCQVELKIDAPVHKKSIAALRCFSRAVEIDESVRKLWIEYGALAYQLHSHASRQLRMVSAHFWKGGREGVRIEHGVHMGFFCHWANFHHLHFRRFCLLLRIAFTEEKTEVGERKLA